MAGRVRQLVRRRGGRVARGIGWPSDRSPGARRLIVTGNCQAAATVAALKLLLPDAALVSIGPMELAKPDAIETISRLVGEADDWVAMLTLPQDEALRDAVGSQCPPRTSLPNLHFSGFHPDMVYAATSAGAMQAIDAYHSGIALWCWRNGLGPEQAERLFSPHVFAQLGYFDRYEVAREALYESFTACDLDFVPFWRHVKRSGLFMHTMNHPMGGALAQLACQVAVRLGASRDVLTEPVDRYLQDRLAGGPVWPVYPEIGRHLGIPGGYRFRVGDRMFPTLSAYLTAVWGAYEGNDPNEVTMVGRDEALFDRALGAEVQRLEPGK